VSMLCRLFGHDWRENGHSSTFEIPGKHIVLERWFSCRRGCPVSMTDYSGEREARRLRAAKAQLVPRDANGSEVAP